MGNNRFLHVPFIPHSSAFLREVVAHFRKQMRDWGKTGCPDFRSRCTAKYYARAEALARIFSTPFERVITSVNMFDDTTAF